MLPRNQHTHPCTAHLFPTHFLRLLFFSSTAACSCDVSGGEQGGEHSFSPLACRLFERCLFVSSSSPTLPLGFLLFSNAASSFVFPSSSLPLPFLFPSSSPVPRRTLSLAAIGTVLCPPFIFYLRFLCFSKPQQAQPLAAAWPANMRVC
jgi:hypothetical protein